MVTATVDLGDVVGLRGQISSLREQASEGEPGWGTPCRCLPLARLLVPRVQPTPQGRACQRGRGARGRLTSPLASLPRRPPAAMSLSQAPSSVRGA